MSLARRSLIAGGFGEAPEQHRTLAYRIWLSAIVSAGLIGAGELAFAFIDHRVLPGTGLDLMRMLHAAACALAVAALWANRRRKPVWFSHTVFFTLVLAFLPIFALAELGMARLGEPWAPMTGFKLLVVGIALLAPPGLWVGATLIVVTMVEAVVVWSALDHAPLGWRIEWEPWGTIVFSLAAVVLLAHRTRAARVEQRLLEAQLKAQALERVAQLALAVRDAANTPLQSLEVGLALMERHGDDPQTRQRLARAVQRLKQLTLRLEEAEPAISWHRLSVADDPEDVLRRITAELREQLRLEGARGAPAVV